MHTKSEDFNKGFARGWDQGRAALTVELRTNTPKTQQQFYDLTPHDLDTIAMGIALVVLHAADIQTISATMDTQQKLGVAERVLGWLHLISRSNQMYENGVTLHETAPHPWLTFASSVTDDEIREMFPPPSPNHLRQVTEAQEADSDIPF